MSQLLDAADLSALLAATAGGSREAFKALYDETSPKLLGVILRMVKNRAVAEDILQDVYLRIWQNAGQFSPSAGPALGWMISIARYRAIDVLRKKTPDLLAPGEDGSDWLERQADPQDAVGRWVHGQALQHCLERIDPESQECIVLAYCEGWSREELSRKYGRPVNTIKTVLHRGLISLRQCLDET